MGMNLSNASLKKNFASSATAAVSAFLNALASLPASDLEEMKDEDHGAEITCQFCQTHYHFDENDLEELIRDKS